MLSSRCAAFTAVLCALGLLASGCSAGASLRTEVAGASSVRVVRTDGATVCLARLDSKGASSIELRGEGRRVRAVCRLEPKGLLVATLHGAQGQPRLTVELAADGALSLRASDRSGTSRLEAELAPKQTQKDQTPRDVLRLASLDASGERTATLELAGAWAAIETRGDKPPVPTSVEQQRADPPAAAPISKAAEKLHAKLAHAPELVLRDANGRERARLRTGETGEFATLALHDRRARPRAEVTVGDGARAALTLREAGGPLRAAAVLSGQAACKLVLLDRNQRPRLALELASDGSATLAAYDEQGETEASAELARHSPTSVVLRKPDGGVAYYQP